MNTFHFKAYSWSVFALTFLSILILGTATIVFLTYKNDILTLIVSLTIFLGGIPMSLFLARVSTEWQITEEGINLKWISQSFFIKSRGLTIRWPEIKSYKYKPDWRWALFKIRMVDGTMVRFWFWLIPNYDNDFYKFKTCFEKRISIISQSSSRLNYIFREKGFYESKFGAFILMIALLIIFILGFYISRKR